MLMYSRVKKCKGQVSFFNISTTAGLCLNLELKFTGSLLKQPEDHDRRIFLSYCLLSQLCPAGMTTLIFKLLFQGAGKSCAHLSKFRGTLELSKTDRSKIMPSFFLGKTALSSSSTPINGSLTTVYISNSKCRKKRKEKGKKTVKEKKDFKVKMLCLIFPWIMQWQQYYIVPSAPIMVSQSSEF